MTDTAIDPVVRQWLSEIRDARKREKDFRDNGEDIINIYECEKVSSAQNTGEDLRYPFNILFSNTDTIAPVLYNSTPRPLVQSRFHSDDRMVELAADMVQKCLSFMLDSDMRQYPTFDDLMNASVLHALLPGRGQVRFRYDAEIVQEQAEQISIDPDQDQEQEGQPDGDEAQTAGELRERVASEMVVGDLVPWNRFLHGYATTWQSVPWVAFELPMTEDELRQNFGDITGFELIDIESEPDDDSHSTTTQTKGAWVYEIWDKRKKQVLFISESYKLGVIKQVDDPLGLSGFFPCPEPLTFITKVSGLTPLPLYGFYEQLAEELNALTVRIRRLVSALKVRGFYDSTIDGIEQIFTQGDNTLLPVNNVAALQNNQSLQNAIIFVPVEQIIVALRELYVQREQVKQTIYEVSGIADIMRGATSPTETLGAQQLKTQWGTLRLKTAQTKVANYARNCLRIMTEIAFTKFSAETMRSMTGVKYPTQQEQMEAQQQMAMYQMSGQQPPPQLQQVLAMPTIESLMDSLRDDIQRAYVIDIETDSTVLASATQDKAEITEFMQAFSGFFATVSPMVQSGVLPFDAAKAILLAITRRYQFGLEVEDEISKMQEPATPPGGASDPQMQAEQAKQQTLLMAQQAKQQQTQSELQADQLRRQMAMQERSTEHQMKMDELQARAIERMRGGY